MNPAFDLRLPVTVTTNAGRTLFTSSWKLMNELAIVDGSGRKLLQLLEGEQLATPGSIAGINTYLGALGLRQFRRQQGEGAWFTRHGWAAFKELVGVEFEGKNVVIARLPVGPYFGVPGHPALLVANWDGDFEGLRRRVAG